MSDRSKPLAHLSSCSPLYQPDGDDEWRRFTPLCREYTSSRSNLKAKPLAAVPQGTIIGPVVEVHGVPILDECGLEVAIPSICKSRCGIKRD